ncbi:aminodeoxychorismate synthase component I [soil metagenome]
MNKAEFINSLNTWGQERVPFLFLMDFEMQDAVAYPLSEINSYDIRYDFQGFTNDKNDTTLASLEIQKFPVSFENYSKGFNIVKSHLNRGDSFLTNLTIRTEIKTGLTLEELYRVSRARYKFFYRNQFIVFSPESFIQIRDDKIFSFPMKGTIDASVPNAKEIILKDPKELSEHITIVDLIRNDLSCVASNVEVTNFRYVEQLKTHDKNLLQVSTEITGRLEGDYWSRIGTIITSLLPAGSISGAPKARTIDIIREVEKRKRGYYTGVCGYFDGEKLDSAVMIRFIENIDGSFYYRSGGGITAMSTVKTEYNEAIDKIYVPID